MPKRTPNRKPPRRKERVIDAAALIGFAEQLDLHTGAFYVDADDWTVALADRFLVAALKALRSLETEREALKDDIRDGRRYFGPDHRALGGAKGTLQKAVENPHGFDVERLQMALDTVTEYTEHLRLQRFAVHVLDRPKRRPRATETERGRMIDLATRIAVAAGSTKAEAKKIAKETFVSIDSK